ncbi:hypothetical protein AR158_C271L [Paramecium bursaria Chlorella virus AR158]|uniref:hypothetical protein n=1 Tax=Paramecium bursaria Chlorella virus AR158 TaxID=380598 RepID=UPI00015AA8DF|nr:hypothetical protein AR158_C271L [Paramecium bursaria Chlorella virus AR158]ABU43816.1 hypothetical protein AR158_C271L [Paramecium bursaria Chlorella virus AR158]
MDINTAAVHFCNRNQIVSSIVCAIVGSVALWSSVETHNKHKTFSWIFFVVSILLFGYALTSYALRDNIAFCSLVI